MSRIIISSNVDSVYFATHNDDWIKSVLKNKSKSMEALLLTVGFNPDISEIECAFLSKDSLGHSTQKYSTGKRANFICLETGEFIDFLDLEDEDVFILCDYDVTMQREMSQEEIDSLLSLGEFEFAASRDDYSGLYNLTWFFEKFSKSNIFDNVDEKWQQYNTGIQAGKVSAWRNLFNAWKVRSEEVTFNIPYHFAFQLFFSYFIQKNGLLVDMGPTFHNAHWFRDTPASVCAERNMLVMDNTPVLFYHHKFNNRPDF